ncbi:hypothetical protein BGZ83_005215 [Gryganskiella cystojenkinii]|nr:hypothetical protein BGZ83_005215 [Gryganskiella cystojenkinii]
MSKRPRRHESDPKHHRRQPPEQQQQQQQQKQRLRRSQHKQSSLSNRLVVSSNTSSPVAIPELLERIGSYLPLRNLVPCLQVSRDWYRTFIAEVWSTTVVNLDKPEAVPSFTVLTEKSSFIRKLILYVPSRRHWDLPSGNDLTLQLPNLSEFVIRGSYCKPNFPVPNEQSIIDFLTRHQSSLESVSFPFAVSDKLLQALSECDKLEDLDLLNMDWDSVEPWTKWYGPLWSKTRTLRLGGARSYDQDQEVSDLTLDHLVEFALQPRTKLKELYLKTDEYDDAFAEAYITLIYKSPGLTRLDWSLGSTIHSLESTSVASLARGFEEYGDVGFCGRLEHLSLSSRIFRNTHLKTILESLSPCLKHLNFEDTVFDDSSWELLKAIPRYLSLTSLELQHSPMVTSGAIQEILCSMPCLEVFSGDFITDFDILGSDYNSQSNKRRITEGQTWICNGLKELRLGFFMTDRDSEGLVLGRLAKLTKLEVLKTTYEHRWEHRRQIENHSSTWKKCSLRLNLKYGLDELKTLKQLRILSSEFASWNGPEAKWVLEHWKCLERVGGGMKVNKLAEALLRPRIKLSIDTE